MTPNRRPARLVVLVSGSGSTLAALLHAAGLPDFPADIVAVGADRPDAYGLRRAADAGIPTFVVPPADHVDRAAWDIALRDALLSYRPDWLICAGFMRILGPAVLGAFDQRIVNTHPALLPAFPGAHAVRDALAYGVKVTGATVHLVDAGVDTGPILAQTTVAVLPDDDESSLRERIQRAERALFVEVVTAVVRDGVTVMGRTAVIGPSSAPSSAPSAAVPGPPMQSEGAHHE